jgi:biopolymer transport protein TolQ
MIEVFVATAHAAADIAAAQNIHTNGVTGMVAQAGPMVKFVLLVLALLSVVSWAIIFIKFRLLRRARQESSRFMDLYWQRKNFPTLYRDSKPLENSHLAQVFQMGYEELSRLNKYLERTGPEALSGDPEMLLENVERAMRGAILAEEQRLERFVPFLATTGNTAPFIGLFGTVWGIMTSFQEIGLKGAANLAVVAPGISEALIATAIGLGTAIPAVVGFNHFTNKLRQIDSEMNNFAADFLNLVKRDLLRRTAAKPESVPLGREAVPKTG